MRVRHAALAASILALGTTGCLTPLDPAQVPIGAVRVTLGDRALTLDTLGVRRTARINAVAVAKDGYELPIANFQYSSSNTAVAVVDSSGVVLAIAPGATRIAAIAPDGTRGEATVVVVPSTVDYEIPVGGAPRAIAFSPDYTKAYVAVAGGSVAFLDAIGFFRVTTLTLGDEIADIAATPSLLYATHSGARAVSVIATATRELKARITLDGSPGAIVARDTRVWIAEPMVQHIVIVDGTTLTTSFAVAGEPAALALSADGSRLYVSLHDASRWSLAMLDPATGTEQSRVPLAGEPVAIAVGSSGDGAERVYAAIPGAGQLLAFGIGGGQLAITQTTSLAAQAGGIAARPGSAPLVVVSGSPLGILDGGTLAVLDTVMNGGSGCVAVRPDGLFVFVGALDAAAVRVIGL